MQVNKVFLGGRLCNDPELRFATSGTAISNFRMAINRSWTSQEGEKKEETCFVDVSVFGKRAEAVNEYFSKGSPIFIEGRLQYQSWEDKAGQKHSVVRVVADNFQFIGSKGEKKEVAKNDIAEENLPF